MTKEEIEEMVKESIEVFIGNGDYFFEYIKPEYCVRLICEVMNIDSKEVTTPTTEEVNKFLDDNYPTKAEGEWIGKTHYITTEEIDERIYLNDYPEEI